MIKRAMFIQASLVALASSKPSTLEQSTVTLVNEHSAKNGKGIFKSGAIWSKLTFVTVFRKFPLKGKNRLPGWGV